MSHAVGQMTGESRARSYQEHLRRVAAERTHDSEISPVQVRFDTGMQTYRMYVEVRGRIFSNRVTAASLAAAYDPDVVIQTSFQSLIEQATKALLKERKHDAEDQRQDHIRRTITAFTTWVKTSYTDAVMAGVAEWLQERIQFNTHPPTLEEIDDFARTLRRDDRTAHRDTARLVRTRG